MDIKAILHRLDELREYKESLEGTIRSLDYESQRAARGISLQRSNTVERFTRGEKAVLDKTRVEHDLRVMKAEEDALLARITPLIERLPVGAKRLITTLRFVDGDSCMTIAHGLHYSRSFVYKALYDSMDLMAQETQRLEGEA